MTLALIILIGFITAFLIIKWLFKLSLKIAVIAIIVFLVVSTSGLIMNHPQMHKPFSFNIVEYFLKINEDGSMSTTKQVTKTVIQDKKEVEKK